MHVSTTSHKYFDRNAALSMLRFGFDNQSERATLVDLNELIHIPFDAKRWNGVKYRQWENMAIQSVEWPSPQKWPTKDEMYRYILYSRETLR